MAVIATLSNHFKYAKQTKQIQLASDTIKCLLMRSGFIFNKDNHAVKKNVKTTSGSIASLAFDDATNTLTRDQGSFITDGFVIGNRITTDSANPANQGPFKVSAVAALVLTVTTMAGGDPALVTETENNVTVNSDDELASGNGYIQDTKVLTGQTVVEDDANDRSEMTCNTITWSAAGGSIGPTPGMMLYDDSAADDPIIGYGAFDGEQTVPNGADLDISNLKIRDS